MLSSAGTGCGTLSPVTCMSSGRVTAAGCGHGSPPLRGAGGLRGGGAGRQARARRPGVQIHRPGRPRGDNKILTFLCIAINYF